VDERDGPEPERRDRRLRGVRLHAVKRARARGRGGLPTHETRGPSGLRLEVVITQIVPGGEGVAIATIDGERRAVFVPGVAIGERVAVDADTRRRPARGRLLQVLEPAEGRVPSPCEHVARCGACDWMHLGDEARAEAHGAIVRGVLPSAFGRDDGAPIEVPVLRATTTLGYRARARVHVEARRGPPRVGMFGRRSHEPVSVDRCVVLAPPIERARLLLAPLLAGAEGRGEAQLSLGSRGVAVIELTWEGELPPAVFGRAEAAVLAGEVAGVRIRHGDVKIPATIGDPTPWTRGGDGGPLRLAAGGFSQASEEGNDLLAGRVLQVARALLDAVPAARAPNVLELYAGAGNLTVLLARELAERATAAGAGSAAIHGGTLVAVESDRAACDAARLNLDARSRSARIVCADAAKHAIPRATDLVVLDPPRAGAKEVAHALAASRVPAVLYVSCDPPTLGRDLAILANAGYRLASVAAVEMFPRTSHVETVVGLVDEGRRR